MEYYLTLKKNESLSFAAKCMELENIIIKINQTQKVKKHLFCFICAFGKSRPKKTEKTRVELLGSCVQ
jgi:hypothetical protein